MRLDDVAQAGDEDDDWEWEIAAARAKAALAEAERASAAPAALPAVLVLTSVAAKPAALVVDAAVAPPARRPATIPPPIPPVAPRARRATLGKSPVSETSVVTFQPASTHAVRPRLSVSTEAPLPRPRPATAPPPVFGVSAMPLAVTPARVTRPPIVIPPKEEPGVHALPQPPRRLATGTAPIERQPEHDDPGALLREAFALYEIADECPRCSRRS